MKQSLTVLVCAAVLGLSNVATAQGPVRRALRGAGQATAGAARATAQGVRAGIDAVTPDVPLEARAGGALIDRNATWRRIQHNGDWWYYTPQNNWMVYRNNDWVPYSADTFTPSAQYVESQDPALQQMVFVDSGGRAVFCQNGRIVFGDGTALRSVPRTQVNAQGYLIEQSQLQAQGRVGGSVQANSGVSVQAQTGVEQSAFVQPTNPAPQASIQGGAQVQDSQTQANVDVQPAPGAPTAPQAPSQPGASNDSSPAPETTPPSSPESPPSNGQ
jgi:hypothetical protein